MSLKAVHILFIIASMLLCLGFGWWAMDAYLAYDGTANLVYAIGSAVLFLALAVYGWFFLKKLRKVNYL
jgi:hypothetical protein